MRRLFHLFLAVFLIASCGAASAAAVNPAYTTPIKPFRIADNLYYVGSRDLASYLVTTSRGDILINTNLVSSPPQIRASVEELGFHWRDIRIVLNSQAHFDHVAGTAEVLRETHARDLVMEGDADVMESGGRTDFAFGPKPQFPRAHVDQVLHDGEAITLGNVTVITYKTAGHTRGCTTFTMRMHMPGDPPDQLRNIVIVGGFTALSEYRLVATPGHPASYPGIASDFDHTFATLRSLPCDIFLGAHGLYFNMLAKLARMPQQGPSVLIDPQGYKAAVADAEAEFHRTLAKQEAEQPR
jgi:metallo-beta-lactamase class B